MFNREHVVAAVMAVWPWWRILRVEKVRPELTADMVLTCKGPVASGSVFSGYELYWLFDRVC